MRGSGSQNTQSHVSQPSLPVLSADLEVTCPSLLSAASLTGLFVLVLMWAPQGAAQTPGSDLVGGCLHRSSGAGLSDCWPLDCGYWGKSAVGTERLPAIPDWAIGAGTWGLELLKKMGCQYCEGTHYYHSGHKSPRDYRRPGWSRPICCRLCTPPAILDWA